MVERRIPNPMVGGSSPSRPARIEVEMGNFLDSFRSAKGEIDKVIFPTKEQVRNAFVTVFLVVTVISLFLALVDLLMSFSISQLV